MTISEMPRTRLEAGPTALNARSRLVMKSAEPSEGLTELLGAQQSGIETHSGVPDPLIQTLVDRLPKPNSIWSIEDRAKWLRAAAVIFNLVYKADEGEGQGPAFSKQKAEPTAAA